MRANPYEAKRALDALALEVPARVHADASALIYPCIRVVAEMRSVTDDPADLHDRLLHNADLFDALDLDDLPTTVAAGMARLAATMREAAVLIAPLIEEGS